MLIPLMDGYIEEIESENDFTPSSCETCDFGSYYSSTFVIILSSGEIVIQAEKESDYPLSEGMMMRLFLQQIDIIRQMSEDDFIRWLDEKCDSFGCDEISFTYMPKTND